MTIQGKNDIRCPVCLAEFNLASVRELGCKDCPHCHTSLPMLKISEDGYIRLNWQDVRVLAIYAQRWAIGFDTSKKGNVDAVDVLDNILQALDKFRPKDGLTLWLKDTEIERIGKAKREKEIERLQKLGILSPYYKKHF